MSRRATRASQRSSLARGEERTRTRGVPLALTRHEERTRDMNYAIAQHGLDWRWHTTTTASRHRQDFLLVTTQPTQRTERSGEEQLVPLLPTWSTLFRQKTYFLLPFPALMSTNLMLERSESANLFKDKSSHYKVWNEDDEMESVKRRWPVLHAPCVNINEVLRSILNAFVLVPRFWFEMYWLEFRLELECPGVTLYQRQPPPPPQITKP